MTTRAESDIFSVKGKNKLGIYEEGNGLPFIQLYKEFIVGVGATAITGALNLLPKAKTASIRNISAMIKSYSSFELIISCTREYLRTSSI